MVDIEREGIVKEKLISSINKLIKNKLVRGFSNFQNDEDLIDFYIFRLCKYYPISSKEFGGDPTYPEQQKIKAWDLFEKYVNSLADRLGYDNITMGFSDDDESNVDSMVKFFKTKNKDSNIERNVYQTNTKRIQRKFKETF